MKGFAKSGHAADEVDGHAMDLALQVCHLEHLCNDEAASREHVLALWNTRNCWNRP